MSKNLLERMKEIQNYTKEDWENARKLKLTKVYNELIKIKDISNLRLEEKDGWGKVYRFEYKGNDLIVNGFNRGHLDVYYYNDDYTCKPCMIRIFMKKI